jgi:pseudouridine synthase
MLERIQKILAQMGIASRRKAEELMVEGRVTVNGRKATLGMKADPLKDHIKLDGKLLTRMEPKVYYMWNKPKGVVTSLHDPEGRATVKDYTGSIHHRVFPVGRLDYDSEGLLLVTNDGDFAYRLLHPSKQISKTYHVKVKGIPAESALRRLRNGIRLEDGMTAPLRIKLLRTGENNAWIEIIIHEGRNRQVRRMMEAVSHPVLKLKRMAIDGLKMRGLAIGALRPLTEREKTMLLGTVPILPPRP